MIRAGTGYSKNRNAQTAAREAARKALDKASLDSSRLVVLFISASYRNHYPVILQEIRRVTQAEHIIGSGAYGVLTEESEIEKQYGIAVMAISDDGLMECASLLVTDLQENNFRAGTDMARIISKAGFYPSALVLFADPFSFQNHLFFEGFESAFNYIPITGGMSSENGKEDKTFQLAGGRVSFDSAAALALGGSIRVESALTRSCQPFGEPLRITKAEGNQIFEIDGRPAYDILLESISHTPIANTEHLLQQIFFGIPVRSFQTDFTNSPYLIRNIMGINAKKGMLTCISPIPEGEFVTFAFQNPEFARQNLRDMLEDLSGRIAPARPAFGFYFNSCARGTNLYKSPNVDTQMIREYFPNTPIIGFSSYGEIAPVDFVNHLHHYSGVLTLVMEESQ
jgi:small ligand-binding sensory domain FIST